ncbi:MAG TPA: hypothetical protein VFM98_24760, partial [Ramlibacter sp.]|nr:hypothetical protein [Ramlibacter sp.]
MLTRRCSMLACAAVLAGCTGAFAQARRLQAEALANLTGPAVSLTGFTGRVSTTLNFDVSRLANAVNPLIGTVDAAVPALDIPPVPQVLSVPRTFNLRSLGLSADWPLYTGGRLEAVQGLAAGRAHEAE